MVVASALEGGAAHGVLAAMLRCGETVAEEEDDDEYAKLVRRMNPPRYVRWQRRLGAGRRCQSRSTSSEFACSFCCLPLCSRGLLIAFRVRAELASSLYFSVVSFCKLLREGRGALSDSYC